MLTAVNGYYNGKSIVMEERVKLLDGQKVIITILDGTRDKRKTTRSRKSDQKTAARKLAGLWINHDNDKSVNETVRELRRGRTFDH